MGSIIQRVLKQKAVYWQQIPGARDDYGQPTFLPPVEIKCRWSDKFELIKKSETESLQVRSKVMVDRTMKENDRLMKGPLEVDTPSDPTDTSLTNVFPIVMFKEVPDFRARNTYRVAFLSNYVNG